ncbi:MAG: TonB-dependent receptor plug domain-containing protein [Chthoniobacterales bacterium]|nr:TonB-dependent receptor plug domain-containing protein [Chthoniobacterales bacterium]
MSYGECALIFALRNCAGADGVSDVTFLMINRAFLAVMGVLSLCLSVTAQTISPQLVAFEAIAPEQLRLTGAVEAAPALALYRPDVFSTAHGSVLIHGLPALSLLDGRRFPISSEVSRMGMTPLDLLPTAFLSAVEVQKIGASPVYGSDAPGGAVNLRLNRIQTGGEVGFFYGRSEGKYGREDTQAYIIGGVGNEKFQITAGAAFQESEWRGRRSGR